MHTVLNLVRHSFTNVHRLPLNVYSLVHGKKDKTMHKHRLTMHEEVNYVQFKLQHNMNDGTINGTNGAYVYTLFDRAEVIPFCFVSVKLFLLFVFCFVSDCLLLLVVCVLGL